MPTVLVKNAEWAVVWETTAPESGSDLHGGRHAFLRDGDLAFDGDRIVFVGKGYAGTADQVIDGRGKLLLPGFVNIHSHPNSEPLLKGLSEERKSRQLNMSSLYEYIFLLGRPAHDLAADADTTPFGAADFPAYSAACRAGPVSSTTRPTGRTGSTRSRAPASAPWSRRRSARASGTRPTATRCSIAGTSRAAARASTPRLPSFEAPGSIPRASCPA